MGIKHTYNYGFFVESKCLINQTVWCPHELVEATAEALCLNYLYKMLSINEHLLPNFRTLDSSDQTTHWHTISIQE